MGFRCDFFQQKTDVFLQKPKFFATLTYQAFSTSKTGIPGSPASMPCYELKRNKKTGNNAAH